MRIGMDRRKLENELYKALYDINMNRDVKNKIFKRLMKRGFPVGSAQQILSGNAALEFLDELELGVVTYEIFRETYSSVLDPSIYFDIKELKRIQALEFEKENKELTFPIKFEHMIQQGNNRWVGIISIQDFVKLNQSGIVTYNFETQRNPVYEKFKGKTIRKANINPKSVKEIADAIVSNTYEYDDVTINILADGEEDFEFNVVEVGDRVVGDIVINNATLNLIDGAHREKGAETALLRNPNLEGYFILVLTNFDVDEANHYIIQKDKRNPISKEYIESKDIANLNNDVVRRLNENMKSELRGKIVTDGFLLKQGDGLALFSTLSKTIERLWNVETRKDARVLSNYLIAFFNELVGIFPNELKLKVEETKGKTLINHPNMFIYYLSIAEEIQDEEDWEDLLYDIIDKTNFDNTDEWRGTVLYVSGDLESRLTGIIRAHREKIEKIRGDLGV